VVAHATTPQECRRRGVAVCMRAFVAGLLCFTFGQVAATGTVLGATPSPTSATHCSVNAELVPSCGDWWGEAVPNSGSDLLQAVSAAEFQTQRPLDIVHTYHRWLQAFPTPEETELARSGHLLLINWQPTGADGRPIPWSAIADGFQDTAIKAEALRLAAFDLPVMVSFSHEPEANLGKEGSAADFAAAFRHVHDVVTATGASNVVWVWDVEGVATRHWEHLYRELWPGSASVDWIAWDPYNFASCKGRQWRSFEKLVSPFYRWIESQPFGRHPLMLAEFGTVGASSGLDTKQAWFAGIPESLARFPAVKGLVYFDYPSPPASCDWTSNSVPAAASAFAALARNKSFVPYGAISQAPRTAKAPAESPVLP
jgi:hypothetical protein